MQFPGGHAAVNLFAAKRAHCHVRFAKAVIDAFCIEKAFCNTGEPEYSRSNAVVCERLNTAAAVYHQKGKKRK